MVSVAEAKNPTVIPDSINITGFVIAKYECGPTAWCSIPDRIIVAEKPSSSEIDLNGSLEFACHVSRFPVGGKYVFSLKISDKGRLSLIGYNRRGLRYTE